LNNLTFQHKIQTNFSLIRIHKSPYKIDNRSILNKGFLILILIKFNIILQGMFHFLMMMYLFINYHHNISANNNNNLLKNLKWILFQTFHKVKVNFNPLNKKLLQIMDLEIMRLKESLRECSLNMIEINLDN